MTAKEIIIKTIRERVAVMNIYSKEANTNELERLRNELNGMMICLKAVAGENEFYNINYHENGIEFGYYDSDGKWWTIEK